jgi:hypothetical protein
MNSERPENDSLSGAHIDSYGRDGFVRIRNVFGVEDVGRWRAECDRLWASLDAGRADPRVQWRGHQKQGRIADRLDPVIDISPEFARLARDPRLTGAAAAVAGSDVVILKGKLIMKRSGTLGYGLHQDYPYWNFLGVPADHMVVVLIPLDVSNIESGAIEFFPGRHRERISSLEDSPLDTDPSKIDLSTGTILQLEPGDIALFHALTPHRSGPNTSDHGRRALYFTYVQGQYGNIYERYYSERPEYDTH